MDLINSMIERCTNLILDFGPLAGCFLVLLESFLPMLPLGVIVTLNINAFGFFFGTVISWLATCVGCLLAYSLFYNISNKFILKHISEKHKKRLLNGMAKFKDIPFSHLVIIITLPFTPSFLINILAGFAGMKKEKYILALLIGKLFMIIFWGYIGKSFIESMTDLGSIIFLVIAILVAYVISKIVSKKFKLE